jgi:hypothetical protein
VLIAINNKKSLCQPGAFFCLHLRVSPARGTPTSRFNTRYTSQNRKTKPVNDRHRQKRRCPPECEGPRTAGGQRQVSDPLLLFLLHSLDLSLHFSLYFDPSGLNPFTPRYTSIPFTSAYKNRVPRPRKLWSGASVNDRHRQKRRCPPECEGPRTAGGSETSL